MKVQSFERGKIFNKRMHKFLLDRMSLEEVSKIAVIGAGNVGKAMAAHLTIKGYDVNLFNRTEEHILPLKNDNKIRICGLIEGIPEIKLITSDIQKAIEDVDIIMVTSPASGHISLANSLGPHLHKDQLIILNPGRTLGSLEFYNVIKKYKKNNIVSEAQTILYTTRYCDMNAEVFAIKNKVSLATFPACQTGEVLDVLKPIYPQFVAAKDILETGFNNVGAILHPTPTILNIGGIENNKTPFKYYYDGITPTIAGFLETMDQERVEIAKTCGYHVVSVKEWLYEVYGSRGRNLYDTIQNTDAYRMIDAPEKVHHRYIFEDIPTGLVPLSSMGEKIQKHTPNINAIIELASRITNTNFRQCGRTLENCGVSRMNMDELKSFIQDGDEAS